VGPLLDEDLVVRQYRFLLRTAPLDALEAAHAEALEQLGPHHRSAVLRAVQVGLVAGLRLGPYDVRRLARLVSLGERRAPGAFLRASEPHVLRALADAVVLAEASFGLFGGYAAWDGSEPPTPEDGWSDGGFGEPWHDALVTRVIYRDFAGGPSSPDAVFGQ
jgi:hypothetical protein